MWENNLNFQVSHGKANSFSLSNWKHIVKNINFPISSWFTSSLPLLCFSFSIINFPNFTGMIQELVSLTVKILLPKVHQPFRDLGSGHTAVYAEPYTGPGGPLTGAVTQLGPCGWAVHTCATASGHPSVLQCSPTIQRVKVNTFPLNTVYKKVPLNTSIFLSSGAQKAGFRVTLPRFDN